MKVLVIIFVAYLTGTNGQLTQIFVENILDRVKQNLTESGYDPMEIKGFGFNYSLPVTDLLAVQAGSGGAEVTGISNIILNRFRYNVLLSQATFTVTLPLVTLIIRDSNAGFKLLDLDISGKISGSVEIIDIVVSGTVLIRLRLTGVEVRSVTITIEIGNIRSNLEVNMMDQDISDRVNSFMNTTLLNSLNNHSDEIEELIEYYIMQAIENS